MSICVSASIVVCNDMIILSFYVKLIFESTSPLNTYCNRQNKTLQAQSLAKQGGLAFTWLGDLSQE